LIHDLLSNPDLLDQLRQKFKEHFPELWETVEQALASEDPKKIDDALQRLFDPEIVARLAEAATGVLPEKVDLVPIPKKLEDARTDQIVAYDSHGNPKLNPLYEAAIAERLQFDGDVPELRHGPVPENSTPAVAVDTTVSNPVALGAMLEKAQEVVQASVEEAREENRRLLEEYSESESTALAVNELPVVESSLYKADHGSVPAPLQVDTPSGAEIAALSPAKKKALVWKATSTTQGRRSAVGALEEKIQRAFAEAGLHVEFATDLSDPDFRASWTFPLQKGHNASQEKFSHIETAGVALFKKLHEQLERSEVDFEREVVIHVSTVDGISEGIVGWEASLSIEG